MARKKKPAEHVNHERWLVSYADFITLLFAFFVVMFAVSQVDSKKMGRFTQAFSKAVGDEVIPMGPGKGLLPDDESLKPPDRGKGPQAGDGILPPELEKVRTSLNELAAKSEALQGLQILQRRNELVLRLADNIVFESGDARVRGPAVALIHALAPELKDREVDVRVEGHTDDHPISTARFPSNWELSTARATAVIAKLAGEGIPPNRLAASGYAEFHPIAPNTTEEGRKLNRRVDLVVAVSAAAEVEK
jgi:chemotaxis protein MotB